jgi:hypothetical protein
MKILSGNAIVAVQVCISDFKLKVEIPNKFKANTGIKFFEFRAKRAAVGVTLE